MNRRKLYESIRAHEGFRTFPYTDTTGHLTIGYGTNLSSGISKDEAEALMRHRADESWFWLREVLPYFDGLTEARQRALVEMVYQLGRGKFLGFRRMLQALHDGNYARAAHEMYDSKWYEQTPIRVMHCAKLMEEG